MSNINSITYKFGDLKVLATLTKTKSVMKVFWEGIHTETITSKETDLDLAVQSVVEQVTGLILA